MSHNTSETQLWIVKTIVFSHFSLFLALFWSIMRRRRATQAGVGEKDAINFLKYYTYLD